MASTYEKKPWLQHYPDWAPHILKVTSDTALSDFRASAARTPEAPAIYYFKIFYSVGGGNSLIRLYLI